MKCFEGFLFMSPGNYSWMRAMIEHVELHENFKTGIWPEFTATNAKLENVMVRPHKDKFSYDRFMARLLTKNY